MALRDFLAFNSVRRSKAVPAVIALVIAGFAWVGIQNLLFRDTSQSAPAPVNVQEQAQENAPAGHQPAPQPAETPPVYPKVLVAAHGLRSGVMLTAELVEWQEWVEPIDLNMVLLQQAVPLQAILGSVTRQTYAAGSPIGWDGIIAPGAPGFIGAVLAPGMRAVTVEVDRATTSANIIYPGDRVDVIMVSAQQGAESLAQAIVHNVRVLAVGSTILSIGRYGKINLTATGSVEPVPPPAGENYTLELLPADAERITLAANSGRLTLAMRSVNSRPTYDYDGGNRGPVRLSEVLIDPTPPPPPPPAQPTVRIIRGGGEQQAVAVAADS